jgi:hypothetical protein
MQGYTVISRPNTRMQRAKGKLVKVEGVRDLCAIDLQTIIIGNVFYKRVSRTSE